MAETQGTPLVPEVPVEIGGRERTFRFDFNAFVRAETATGVDMLAKPIGQMTATEFRALVWGGLVHHDKELRLDQVGAWLHPGNYQYVRGKVIEAWNLAFPEPEPKDEDEAEEGDGEAPAPLASKTS